MTFLMPKCERLILDEMIRQKKTDLRSPLTAIKISFV